MVPFHVAALPKPQLTYNITPDNTNTPFVHATVPKEFSVYVPNDFFNPLDMVDTLEPVTFRSLESTPFTYVDTLELLKELSSKLSNVDEFAIDLEANMYRTFQGLTCLMQISTRDEDFIVDTLKLRHSLRLYLGTLFLDPSKKKVMHGAVNDILWLQRDFGIYVCNLFDTHEASRILKLDRNSLQHLLKYFCGVEPDKRFQTSDWRIRPLPHEMLHYAREDTHYLLYIYDAMRNRLVSPLPEFEHPLLEVYNNSHKLCCALYEKELYDENSYKSLFGLKDAGLNSTQLNVVSRLYRWRDSIAREDDESTGYVMPNKLLIEISQKMPKSYSELLPIFLHHNYPNHPYVVEKADEILKIIRESNVQIAEMQHSSSRLPQQGYYLTAPYPPVYYVAAPRRPQFYVKSSYPVAMNPVYCFPNCYNRFIIC